MWLDEQTCLRSSASTQDTQAWGRGLSCPVPTTTHPYLDWLFHTLVEEVEGTGPLHPEGKGRSGFAHGGTGGGRGKGSAWGRGGRLMGREAEGEGDWWWVELERDRDFTLGLKCSWGW